MPRPDRAASRICLGQSDADQALRTWIPSNQTVPGWLDITAWMVTFVKAFAVVSAPSAYIHPCGERRKGTEYQLTVPSAFCTRSVTSIRPPFAEVPAVFVHPDKMKVRPALPARFSGCCSTSNPEPVNASACAPSEAAADVTEPGPDQPLEPFSNDGLTVHVREIRRSSNQNVPVWLLTVAVSVALVKPTLEEKVSSSSVHSCAARSIGTATNEVVPSVR